MRSTQRGSSARLVSRRENLPFTVVDPHRPAIQLRPPIPTTSYGPVLVRDPEGDRSPALQHELHPCAARPRIRGRGSGPPSRPAPKSNPPPRPIVLTPPARHILDDAAAPGAPQRLIGKTISGKYLVRSILGEGEWGQSLRPRTSALAGACWWCFTRQAQRVAVKRFHQEARLPGDRLAQGILPRCTTSAHARRREPCLVAGRLVEGSTADRIQREREGAPLRRRDRRAHPGALGLVAAHEKGDRPPRHQAREHLPHARRVGCPAPSEAARLRRVEDDCPRHRQGRRRSPDEHGRQARLLLHPRATLPQRSGTSTRVRLSAGIILMQKR